jgi:hypothetical protein
MTKIVTPSKRFADRLHLSLLCLVRVGDPTDNPMGYVVGHVLGDLLGHPVAVHTLWCDDQGEVDLPLQCQPSKVVNQNLGLAGAHLHEVAIGRLVHAAVQRLNLVVVRLRLKEVC